MNVDNYDIMATTSDVFFHSMIHVWRMPINGHDRYRSLYRQKPRRQTDNIGQFQSTSAVQLIKVVSSRYCTKTLQL